jgi:hypothetical protein
MAGKYGAGPGAAGFIPQSGHSETPGGGLNAPAAGTGRNCAGFSAAYPQRNGKARAKSGYGNLVAGAFSRTADIVIDMQAAKGKSRAAVPKRGQTRRQGCGISPARQGSQKHSAGRPGTKTCRQTLFKIPRFQKHSKTR